MATALYHDGDATVMGADGVYLIFDAARPHQREIRPDRRRRRRPGPCLKGTASASPVMPDTPVNHVKIAHVLYPGRHDRDPTVAYWRHFRDPAAKLDHWALSSGTGTINGDGILNGNTTNNYPYCQVTITMRCQYGWALSGTYTLDLEMLTGSGDWSLDHSTWTTDDLVKTFTGSAATIYYRRDQTVTEESPIVQAEACNTIIASIHKIQLLDALGETFEKEALMESVLKAIDEKLDRIMQAQELQAA